jgi:cyanophycin synthetase
MSTISPDNLSISPRLLYQEAQKRDIKCKIFDKYTLLMKKEAQQWYVRGSRTSWQSSVGKSLADYKHLTKIVLNHFHIPTANFVVVRNIREIKKVNSLKFPLVGKPTVGNHGDDVVVGIKNITEAEKYATRLFEHGLKKEDEFVLFEEQLRGKEYRILCIDYKFVAASYRKAAFVTGDGKKTIEQLIDEKNSHPWRSKKHLSPLTSIEIDDLVNSYLEEQGYELTSILNKGKEVGLRKTGNLSTGGEAWNVTNEVCEKNKKLFEKIATACDLNTVGIDVICNDLSQPITSQPHAGVIEVNVSPGLRMHHYPLQGEPIDAAGKILDMVEKKL